MQQLKISEWLDKLPEPYRTEALFNFKKDGYSNSIHSTAYDALEHAFWWRNNKQEKLCWETLYQSLVCGKVALSTPPPQPAPVHTWIPVEDLDKYQPIQENKEYPNIIGWFGKEVKWVYPDNNPYLYTSQFIDKTQTHIMILEKPKTTQNDHTHS